MVRFQFMIYALTVTLAGCTLSGVDETAGFIAPKQIAHFETKPDDAPEGTCWGKEVTPAVIETVTRKIPQANADGDASPQYKIVTEPRIVSERETMWFETPCPNVMDEPFIQALQRALSLRGFDAGAASGVMTDKTRSAIRAFQKPQGLDSPTLSLAAARKLGLVALSRETIETL